MFGAFLAVKTLFGFGTSMGLWNKHDSKHQRRIKIILGAIIQIGNVFQNVPNIALLVSKPPGI